MTASVFLFLAAKAAESPASASTGQSVNLYIENDTRGLGGPGSDQAYTNGVRASYVFASDYVPYWGSAFVNGLPHLKARMEESTPNFGFSLAHRLYTPADAQSAELIDDDRPYAAWLYVNFNLQLITENRSDATELIVGTIGENAMGEQIQNGVHQSLGVAQAQGWKNQLGNEVTIQLNYRREIRSVQLNNFIDRRYFDFIPQYGFAFGNVKIATSIGGQLRYGVNLPSNFGPSRASGGADPAITMETTLPKRSSFYFFAGAQGEAVAHNLFLDGNTFHPSHHVTRKLLVLETELGVGGQWRSWSAGWRFVTRSPEFEERDDFNSFASLSLAYLF